MNNISVQRNTCSTLSYVLYESHLPIELPNKKLQWMTITLTLWYSIIVIKEENNDLVS